MISISSDELFRPAIGNKITQIARLCVYVTGAREEIILNDSLLIYLNDARIIYCATRQDTFSIQYIKSCNDAYALARSEDEEEFTICLVEAVDFRLQSVTEVWVRIETESPYIVDVILWDGDGTPRMHLRRESDEIFVSFVDTFPKSVHERGNDSFFGTVAHIRYRMKD